jgi:hypothetical protein
MYEIDFLAVGDESKSGDAITLRYTNPESGEPIIGIIDAGFESSGTALVEHVSTYYNTNKVAFVISHPSGRRPHQWDGRGHARAERRVPLHPSPKAARAPLQQRLQTGRGTRETRGRPECQGNRAIPGSWWLW